MGAEEEVLWPEENFRLAAMAAWINEQFGLAAVSSRTSCSKCLGTW